MKKTIICLLGIVLLVNYFAFAAYQPYNFTIQIDATRGGLGIGANASKADSEQRYYVTQTYFNGGNQYVYYTVQTLGNNIVSDSPGVRYYNNNLVTNRYCNYKSSYYANAGDTFQLRMFVNPGSGTVYGEGRWTP